MTDRKSPLLGIISGISLALCGVLLACLAGEALVRVATASQQNYLIEMWRYATLLKRHSDDPVIGHEHVPGASASLQGVEVSINSLGMRGPEPDLATPGKRRIVIIGDSIAMGWGVPERDTLRAQLAARLGPNAEVMTTGVGNMNMTQIVAHWLRFVDTVRPDTVIVLATARAPAVQDPDKAGWLVRHSQLYALIVSFIEMAMHNTPGQAGLVEAYEKAWSGGPGRTAMDAALDRLQADQAAHKYRVVVLMIPEPHSFQPYLFTFTNDIMRAESEKRGWTFVDPLKEMQKQPAHAFWVADNDVHPNANAFRVMTDVLAPYLATPRE